jgi:selenocysteine lyase/cysteine desulfurase
MANILSDKEVTEYRRLFPIVNNFIYLDHAGVAPISTRVKSKVNDFIDIALNKGVAEYDYFMEEVEKVRTNFSRLLNSEQQEIAFIKNTSHGLSLIAKGIEWAENDNIIVFQKEFPANLYPWLDLQRQGVEVRQAQLLGGRVQTEEIKKLIDSNTRLLSISSVQFTNGYRADLKKVGSICKKNNILFCVDAIQSLGIVPIDVNELQIDFLAADGHKWLLSSEGTGVLYCSSRVVGDVSPVLIGWKSIVNESEYEKINLDLKPNALKFEEGSFNVLGIFALGASIELLLEIGVERICNRIHYLGDLIIEEIKNRNFILKTPVSRNERAGIISFYGSFDSSLLKDSLYKRNVIVNVRDQAIRVAPHFYNTEDDIKALFKNIDEIL